MNKNEAITKIKRQETRENREEQKGALIYGDQDQYIYIYIQRKGWPDPKGNSVKFNKQNIYVHFVSIFMLVLCTPSHVILLLSFCPDVPCLWVSYEFRA